MDDRPYDTFIHFQISKMHLLLHNLSFTDGLTSYVYKLNILDAGFRETLFSVRLSNAQVVFYMLP